VGPRTGGIYRCGLPVDDGVRHRLNALTMLQRFRSAAVDVPTALSLGEPADCHPGSDRHHSGELIDLAGLI